jgi:putative flavoprotein involved in K+ transport
MPRRHAGRSFGRERKELLMTERIETVIVGAGQAGLATGYHLQRRDRPFVILESHPRVGDIWRERFDSLRLYSPARYDGLPGWGMQLDPWAYPTKDEVGDYLEAYAERFELPVVCGAAADGVRRAGDGYVVAAGAHRFEAANVVVATGTFQQPKVPAFAGELDPEILQLHSSAYRNPGQLRPGPVLVVGCSHSGADIALEVAARHPTTLAGRAHGELPFDIEGRVARAVLPLLWLVANKVLTIRTPIGRRARPEVRNGGGPLLRVKSRHLAAAGVVRTDARVTGVRDGRPELADGTVLDVANVVWCTGFGKDISWVAPAQTGADGWPAEDRGAAPSAPGLYFVGLPFQYAFASMLIGGVGRDAERVADAIAARAPEQARTQTQTAADTPVAAGV